MRYLIVIIINFFIIIFLTYGDIWLFQGVVILEISDINQRIGASIACLGHRFFGPDLLFLHQLFSIEFVVIDLSYDYLVIIFMQK